MTEKKPISTDRQISALRLKEGQKRARFTVTSKHGGGLLVELREGRETRGIYRYRIAGKQHDYVLGTYPACSLAKLRKLHAFAVELVKKGIDPRQYFAQEKKVNEMALTMGELLTRWLDAKASENTVKPQTLARHLQRWNCYLKKHLDKLRLLDLTRSHLSQALEISRRQAKDETRKALGTLNQMLDYAMVHGFIDTNPARLLRPKDFGASASAPRERWLPVSELRALWKALDDDLASAGGIKSGGKGISSAGVISLPAANVIKILILTGCRRSEVTQMRFSQILGNRWVIPETKNGKSHTVYLSTLALSIIGLQRTYSTGDVVFQTDRSCMLGENVAIRSDSITKALNHLRVRRLPNMDAFTVHDLRRSAATNWAERLGTEERVIELCLNHQPLNKLVRTYHRSLHEDKTQRVWIEWGDLVAAEIAHDPQSDDEFRTDNVICVKFGRH
ncbi:MAG: tyrosine-type recombinase/integrase [Plesiomonas sp.]|uniref:tyrosine-type recombinase/integrase n=1 Tax=Plesiomonas sp. TaxID=2486279 RepID=UPI003F39B72C